MIVYFKKEILIFYFNFRLVQNHSETNSACLVQVNNSGFYHNICLDMDINSLSISALLQLNKINEFEGFFLHQRQFN